MMSVRALSTLPARPAGFPPVQKSPIGVFASRLKGTAVDADGFHLGRSARGASALQRVSQEGSWRSGERPRDWARTGPASALHAASVAPATNPLKALRCTKRHRHLQPEPNRREETGHGCPGSVAPDPVEGVERIEGEPAVEWEGLAHLQAEQPVGRGLLGIDESGSRDPEVV